MDRLKTADITLENYESVFEYYDQYEPNKPFLRFAQKAMAKVYNPHVSYADDSKKYIINELSQEHRFILAANHVRYIDHFVVGGGIAKSPALRPLLGNYTTIAKYPYFQTRINRWLTEANGSIPAIRKKDIPQDVYDTNNILLGAALGLMRVSVHKLSQGGHIFAFPEGERNLGDWTKIKRIEAGIGHIAFKAIKQGIPVSILPIGLGYDTQVRNDWRNVSMHVGEPISPPFGSPKKITEELQIKLQDAVDVVVSLAQ